MALTAAPRTAAGPVQAFPSPGSRTLSPASTISFRGLARGAALGAVQVVGSRSGAHPGSVVAHSDRLGASFVPARPFLPGETVTVRTALDVAGGSAGSFTYLVATPTNAPLVTEGGAATSSRTAAPKASSSTSGTSTSGSSTSGSSTSGRYRSRPDLRPPTVTTTTTAGLTPAPGLLFTSSGAATSDVDTGVEIYDNRGEPVWFKPLPPTGLGTLQRITYGGQDALTWFDGTQAFLGGFKGVWVVADNQYRQIAEIAAGNGYAADGHELRISPDGTKALLVIYAPVQMDMTQYGGQSNATVYQAVVQEVDLGTRAVTFEWHSLDEVPVTESYESLQNSLVDYFHINSAEYDTDGNILVSGRHVSMSLKLNRSGATGHQVMWRLGGKHSSYTFPVAGSAPSYPHDVRRRSDGTISLYDNAVGSTQNGRGVTYRLDDVAHTATLVQAWNHVPPAYGAIVGSNRLLSNGNDPHELVSYGNSGIATEYDSTGAKVWESMFGASTWSYRTLRIDGWHATPAEPPALVTDSSTPTTTGYASWNGATDVTGWRLLAGPDADHLRPVSDMTARTGFETVLRALPGAVTSTDTVFVAAAYGAGDTFLAQSTGNSTSTPIQAHYNSLGGPQSFLGSPTGPETQLPDGAYQVYANGSIFYSAATQAWEVHGAIRDAWSSLGRERSVLGYPVNDERGLQDGVGRYNLFANGALYWSPSSGAHETHGLIQQKWSGLGSQNSFLGYPLTDETGTPDGVGRFNVFQGGSIYWTPSTGAQTVYGAIRDEWAALGYERGLLGYPTTDENAESVGRLNRFQNGTVHWSPNAGAHEVHGLLGAHYGDLGEAAGLLGFPVTDETGTPDGVGRFNGFQGGMEYWTPATGAHEIHGAILGAWAGQGYETGPLGYPTSDEYGVPGGRRSDFQHGSLVWDAASGQVTQQ